MNQVLSANKLDRLARRLASKGIAAPAAGRVERRAVAGPAPLSSAQERLWLVDQIAPGSAAYHVPTAVRLTGALSVAALADALTAIVARHEVLRSAIAARGDRPVQIALPASPVRIPVVDVSALPAGAREAAVAAAIAAEARAPFALVDGRLLRGRVVRIAAAEHSLLITVHHIATDLWSMGVIARELEQLYRGALAGAAASLAEPPLQYADYAAWEQGDVDGAIARDLAFWKDALAGMPVADLGDRLADHPGVASGTGGPGAMRALTVPAATAQRLRALCAAEGVTPFTALLAAFQILLARTSGQHDLAIGSPVSGRDRSELEGLVGMLVNTVVLRTSLAGDPTVRALLGRVRETTLGAFSHQRAPFERVVEAVGADRAADRPPLFQVMFSVESGGAPSLALAGLDAARERAHSGAAKFDLTLTFLDTGDALHGSLEYRRDRFEPATIDRLVDGLLCAIDGLVADPARPISSVPVLRADERARLIAQASGGVRDDAGYAPAHVLIARHAARAPDEVAVRCGDVELTAGALRGRVLGLAAELAARGVGPESRVAIHMNRSVDMVVAVLAVLETGAAYVPVDPSTPAQRAAFLCGDAGVRVCLTDAALAAAVPAGVEALVAPFARTADAAPLATVDPESLAYVLYTSGTTGTPKGVMVSHRGLWSYLAHCLDAYRTDSRAGAPVHSSLAFDFTVTSLLGALVSGRPVRMIPDDEGVDGLIGELRAARRYSVVKITPAHIRMLASQLDAATVADAAEVYVIGGEALHAEDVAFLRRHAPAARLINEYGPTEAVVGCANYQVAAGDPPTGAISIGRAIPGVELHVLDASLEPAPVGVVGELYIAGVQLARGYLARPGLTAARFLPHPHGQPGARLYRTGDLARVCADGTLDYLGRVDQQVKIRGHRVELEEVEAALAGQPGIAAAAVVVAGDRLDAYVVADAIDASALRDALRAWLPPYAIPGSFTVVDALPLTVNGKVDRAALARTAAPARVATAPFRAPQTAAARTLAGIWSELLGVPRVGLDDDFFALGGHSLLATQVSARARAALGVELPLRAIFEAPRLEALAARLGEGAAMPALERLADGAAAPASFAQRRLWFLQQLDPADPSYNIPFGVALGGALRTRALADALAEIVRRHTVLRSVFAFEGGDPVQRVVDVVMPLPVVDVSALPAGRRDAEVQRLAGEQSRRPFDLTRGPMLRVGLVRSAADAHVGVIVAHHIACDAESTGLFLGELGALYDAFGAGAASPLAELPVRYADFAAWQRRWLDGDALAESMAFWRRALADRPRTLDLPTDRPRPRVRTLRGGQARATIPSPLASRLRAVARDRRTTLYATLLSGFAALLSRVTRQKDLVIGTPVAQRSHVETEPVIGVFQNVVPIRVDVSGDPSFDELIGRVRASTTAALAHQDVPFEHLVERLGGDRDLVRTPLFEVMFTMQDGSGHHLRLAGVDARPVVLEAGTARFDLTVNAIDTGDELALAAEYSADLFDASTVEHLLAAYLQVLAAAAADPDRRVAAAPLVADADRPRVLAAGRGPTAAIPERAIHEVIAEVAAGQPDAPAVIWPGGALSYRDLRRRASQLARHLQRRGIGTEDLVAICVRPSPEMIVGLLGVLEAGAAYLPLDPEYPRDRLQYMLDDSRAALVITEEAIGLGGDRALYIDRDQALVDAESDQPLDGLSGPDHAVYVIYTSGTTGRPKGTVITHRALLNHAAASRASYRLAAGSRMLQYSSLCFDASAEDIFPTLTAGAALVCHPSPGRLSMGELAALCTDLEVTTLHLPTAVWHELADAVVAGKVQLPRSLAVASAGGEGLDMRRLAAWLQVTGVPFLNQYGPTEATITASTLVFEPRAAIAADAPAVAPLGHTLPNVAMHVLDEHLAPQPVGIPGELYIGGVALARGYLGRPGLTAEKFVPDPSGSGARLYRTGDLARLRADGMPEYLGRIDHQVKLRGFRVELPETEAVLARHPSVRDVVAIIAELAPGDRRMVAYVVPEGALDRDALRAHARGSLPEYMVPSLIVELPALPRTLNGKLDRAALPRPTLEASTAAYVAPRSDLERRIAAIWSEVLGVERVGASDNFFDLGGHSMLAVRVHERIVADIRPDVPLLKLFEHPTVAALAAALASPVAVTASADEGRARAEARRSRRRRTS